MWICVILLINHLSLSAKLYSGQWFQISTGELGYAGPLYDRFLHMTNDMLDPGPMHINYSSYVYDGFCI